MTELHALRSFREGVALPSPSARATARDALLATMRDASVDRRQRRPLRRLVLALAAGAVVAVSAFAIATLVDGGPGVVERAQAAIDPRGRVLHVVARVVAADGSVSIGESWVRPDGSGRTLSRSGQSPCDCLAGPDELRCYDSAHNVIDVYRYNPEAWMRSYRAGILYLKSPPLQQQETKSWISQSTRSRPIHASRALQSSPKPCSN